jgi:CBS domain-containing protein
MASVGLTQEGIVMQAREIMSRPVITFTPDTAVRHAAAVLTEKQITAAPVLDNGGELAGMVSEGDLITDRFCHDPRSHVRRDQPEQHRAPQTVGEVMTTTVVAMSASADAADLAETMLGYDVRSVPILEGAEVVGIVSRRDLLRILVRSDDLIRAEVATRLEAYTGGRRGWRVEVTEGRVDLFGEPDDDAEARVLEALAGTVPGAGSVHMHRDRLPAMSGAPARAESAEG